MKHLTDAELVDLLDAGPGRAQVPADRQRHLDACGPCRTRVDALQATLADALIDPAPDPSPLFWKYFAARVSNAIRDESPAEVPAASVAAWRQRPLAQWAIAASMAVLVMTMVLWRATLHAPATVGSSPMLTAGSAAAPGLSMAADAPALPLPDDLDHDEAWAVVRTAAEGLAWDDAHAVGITAGPGAAEGLALELTADERTELARLIDRELKRSGA